MTTVCGTGGDTFLRAKTNFNLHLFFLRFLRDMIVATEIIDDILKGAVKTDNNSTKRKHSVTDKTFVTCLTWKKKFPWLCKVEKNGIPYLQCTECISAASKGIKIGSVYSYNNFQQIVVRIAVNLILTTNNITDWIMRNE